MEQQKQTQTTYRNDRDKVEADVLRDFNEERRRGTMTTKAYQNAADKNNIDWWQAFYIVKKARRAGKEVL